MIDFYRGELSDILPVNLKTPENLALSYAVGRAMRRLQDFSGRIHMYSDLEQLPEEILDLIALECNTQYYDQRLPRDVKESLIAQTLIWYMHGGTPSVLKEFIDTVLQGGVLEEWYEYGGLPYYFKVYVNVGEDNELPVSYGQQIRNQISIYKNTRSWLEMLIFVLTTCFQIELEYESRITLCSCFFPRANREFLYLDDTWRLDGQYLLDGFLDSEPAEFYPARLGIRSDCLAEYCVDAGLRVEKDLRYLDDTWLLDDTCILDSEILEYD